MGVEVTVLVDNACACESLRGEHGLSLMVRGDWGRVLLDTGASGEVLRHNAAAMGVDLTALRATVLSHGHYDHAGGLAWLAEQGGGGRLYCHPEAFGGRYVEHPGQPLKSVGPTVTAQSLRGLGLPTTEVTAPMQLEDGLILSGPIGGPRWGAELFAVRRGEELVEDLFSDEIFVLARATDGWAVLCGCCHRGLPNTLRLARFLIHDEPIAAVVGGLHLRHCGPAEMEEVVALLQKYGAPAVHAAHCTGEPAVDYLLKHYPGRTCRLLAGTTLEL